MDSKLKEMQSWKEEDKLKDHLDIIFELWWQGAASVPRIFESNTFLVKALACEAFVEMLRIRNIGEKIIGRGNEKSEWLANAYDQAVKEENFALIAIAVEFAFELGVEVGARMEKGETNDNN